MCSDFDGGVYHGKLVFPAQYPFKVWEHSFFAVGSLVKDHIPLADHSLNLAGAWHHDADPQRPLHHRLSALPVHVRLPSRKLESSVVRH